MPFRLIYWFILLFFRCRVPETVLLCSHTLCPAACQGLNLFFICILYFVFCIFCILYLLRSQAGPGSGHAGGEGGDQGGDEEEGGIQASWRRFWNAKDFQVNYHAQSYFKEVCVVMFQPRSTFQKTICICPCKVYWFRLHMLMWILFMNTRVSQKNKSPNFGMPLTPLVFIG